MIHDPEVQLLANFSLELKRDYADSGDEIWQDSPFDWLRHRPSRQKGAIFEKLVSGYMACKGFDVTRSPDTEADRIIAGVRTEIKGSTLWHNGQYKFQQIRDQNYRFVICLGISPFDAHCWVIPKQEVIDRWQRGDIQSQHGGGRGTDTAWLTVKPCSPPAWLGEWGGGLITAAQLVTQITGQRPLE